MRVTYELGKEPSISASVDKYVNTVHEGPRWTGGRAEVTFFIDQDEGQGGGPGEVNLECEDAEALRDALRQAAGILDDLISWHKEDVADLQEHTTLCGFCGCHVDSRRPKEWGHADGKGHTCLGDGTRLIRKRKVLAYRSDGEPPCWQEVSFESLQPHEKFRIKEPCGDGEEGVTFEAVDVPARYYDGYHSSLGVRFILPGSNRVLSLVP